jgi:hypothetical protein
MMAVGESVHRCVAEGMDGQAGDVQAETVSSGTVEAEREARLQHEDVSVA